MISRLRDLYFIKNSHFKHQHAFFAGGARIAVLPAATGAELGPFLKPMSPPIRTC
jgi:hypothetical protein